MTTAQTAMPTPSLAAALAAFQAQYPAISKGETATVPTKTGGTYSYTYANLADISEVAMPLLGKLGLAFSARPTVQEGKFVLAYSLLHVSGEREDGIYPLNGSTPQAIGGEITYARRYALCAVTGIAPADSDDDAQAAQQEAKARFQSAGAAFDQATPAPPRRPQQPANGTAVTPEPQDRPGVSATELDPDAQQFADEAHEANTLPALHEIHVKARDDHKLAALVTNPATGGKGGLGQYLNYRKGQLQKADKAFADLVAAGKELGLEGDELAAEFQRLAGCSLEAATVEQLDQTTAKLRSLSPAGG